VTWDRAAAAIASGMRHGARGLDQAQLYCRRGTTREASTDRLEVLYILKLGNQILPARPCAIATLIGPPGRVLVVGAGQYVAFFANPLSSNRGAMHHAPPFEVGDRVFQIEDQAGRRRPDCVPFPARDGMEPA